MTLLNTNKTVFWADIKTLLKWQYKIKLSSRLLARQF